MESGKRVEGVERDSKGEGGKRERGKGRKERVGKRVKRESEREGEKREGRWKARSDGECGKRE